MKHALYGVLLVLCAGVAGCALFLGAVSIWVGIHHEARAGAGVPILAGALAIALVLILFIRLFRILYGHMRSRESIDL
jgi:uncharacterized membrane protein HdeD (DUF308 family)